MSGGYFEYKDEELKYSLFGWTDKYKNILEDREISELVWDVLTLLHEYDWYKSGDNGRDDYLEAKRNFKKKWFAPDTVSMPSVLCFAIIAGCITFHAFLKYLGVSPSLV